MEAKLSIATRISYIRNGEIYAERRKVRCDNQFVYDCKK